MFKPKEYLNKLNIIVDSLNFCIKLSFTIVFKICTGFAIFHKIKNKE